MKKPGEFRKGKTAKDHASGSWTRNKQNKQERAAWNNEITGKRDTKTFPYHTCNGKKNRFSAASAI